MYDPQILSQTIAPSGNVSLLVLAAVLAAIAGRQLLLTRVMIWQIMFAGSVAVLLTGSISPADALRAINLDVMLFLTGMFVVGVALEESGYLANLSSRIFRRAGSVDQLILAILFGTGILSAILMNDTLAIVGTPLLLHFAKKYDISPKLLLLSLAFGVTIGSVASPIGNPQNLLIALGDGVPNPFVTFFCYLALPTAANLLIAYGILRLFYWREFGDRVLNHGRESVDDRHLAHLSRASLALIVALITVKIVSVSFGFGSPFGLTEIALLSALPILVFSPRRVEVAKKVDWRTLVFFASMFVLMESVWDAGLFQAAINGSSLEATSIPVILATSALLSQFISNVPFVALYLPLLSHLDASVEGMMALAAGSTIAGNLTILGAASNVIIVQNGERRGTTITFSEFVKVGFPLTAINLLVYWIFLSFL
ncbi:MAG: anion transporter [Methanothrix sp.]|jgi:Na+/H+ antiporter NhaD/arsenite permease-like protein|uniref:Transporter, YbiR family n=1 Tax=Methanothrix harundinacea TaxID=301375 RepID=A0A101IKW7_9EURY|nr:MAG: Transporter, YbiR family [Methanothrix harundinacea]MDD2638958.1 anion transporter [Methanothrix sp.]MDI9399321.1 anion transporter [Euryarchaeota archaeon]KUK97054.1 MAG: Transporter, YbiR family [Methanothrix harundinacea]MCP1393076.1 anion transporter [Methanothrix harundinacea]